LPNLCSAIRATLGQRQFRQSPGLALNAHLGNEWGKIPVLTGFRPLPHPFVLYAPVTGGSSLSLGLGQLWLNLDPFRLLALPVGIAFHHQLVLLSYHPIFLLPYHFLKLVSFLGANRTKSATVSQRLLRGAI